MNDLPNPDVIMTNDGRELDVLLQLQLYQFVIRHWSGHLDSYEFTVLMQIVDRIIGWQKEQAIFRASSLHSGDRLYTGIARAMHPSKMQKALRSLENRGFITRLPQDNGSRVKVYRVNFDQVSEALGPSARGSGGDN